MVARMMSSYGVRKLKVDQHATDGLKSSTPSACYIVARFVFLERLRETKSYQMVPDPSGSLGLQLQPTSAADAAEAAGRKEKLLACLENCAAINVSRLCTRLSRSWSFQTSDSRCAGS